MKKKPRTIIRRYFLLFHHSCIMLVLNSKFSCFGAFALLFFVYKNIQNVSRLSASGELWKECPPSAA